MRIAIVETAVYSDNPIDAHCRNAKEITEYLSQFHQVDLMWSDSFVKHEKYDIVMFSYASFYFQFERFKEFLEINKDSLIGWITNEYNLTPNSFFAKKISFVISNFEKHGNSTSKRVNHYLMTNLNTLFARKRNKRTVEKYDIIYYGTYRSDREIYFKRYFKDKLILSTSTKNKKKFKILGCSCNVIDKLSFKKYNETLNLFKASLYIEDSFTHHCFNNLANRFYEAIFTNTALFIDRSCQSTVEKSNYQLDSFWYVSNYDEIMSKLHSSDFEIKKEQFLIYCEEKSIEEKKRCLQDIHCFIDSLSL